MQKKYVKLILANEVCAYIYIGVPIGWDYTLWTCQDNACVGRIKELLFGPALAQDFLFAKLGIGGFLCQLVCFFLPI